MELSRLGTGSLWHVSNGKANDATNDATNDEIDIGIDLYQTGCDLWHFDGSREMKIEAIHFFRQASEYKNSDAIAWLEWNAVEVEKIELPCLKLTSPVCTNSITDKKEAEDLYGEGIAWWEGNNTDKEQDVVRAVFCMEQASHLGSPSAQLWLDEYSEIDRSYNKGLNYLLGSKGYPEKPHRALIHFRLASQRGHHDAREWVELLEKTQESNKRQNLRNKRSEV